MVIRAKTKTLFEGKELTKLQKSNSDLNILETNEYKKILNSLPRRLFFELTNACNLNCKMCGRETVEFNNTYFKMEWFNYFTNMFDKVEEVTLMGWGEPTIHPEFLSMLRILDNYPIRKYFCTNGMKLGKIKDAIFDYHVDVFAVSVDGASSEVNDNIRVGSKLDYIVTELKDIIKRRESQKLKFPYINFVFCAMKSNIDELPALVRLAHEIGIDEVKVVYFTSFDERTIEESLYDCQEKVKKVFDEAEKLASEFNLKLKLPYIQGEDIAKEEYHKECYMPWRDFFIGSDGFVRPCMSTPVKLFKFDVNKDFYDMWNSEEFQNYRSYVNDTEKMDKPCMMCYQSSFCNWNRKEAFIQIGNDFAPKW